MDHKRYDYFHQNPNALVNGQSLAFNRTSTDGGTQPTNNYSENISSTSSQNQSPPFSERRQINPYAVPLINSHSYQMDSSNQLPRSAGPPRTNAKGIYSQSSIPNVMNIAQSSAENYPINPDFQLQPHLTGLLPQQPIKVPEPYPVENHTFNRGSIAANMNTNYFSLNKSYPEPKIIEYDMEETSTESSPQHTSSLYSESTDQESENVNQCNTYTRHALNKNTECHVTKESKPITSSSQEFPVPSQFADLNLNQDDDDNHQHSILHSAYQDDNVIEDIPLSDNINQNEIEPIRENQENPEIQFNEQGFGKPRTQTYNYFANKNDFDQTEFNYENKQSSSFAISSNATNYSPYNVTISSNIQNPSQFNKESYFSQSTISTQSNSLNSSIPQTSYQKPLFPYSNTELFNCQQESPSIQKYKDSMQTENYYQQNKHIQPVFQSTNFSSKSSTLHSNVINSNMQENTILSQSISQTQPLHTQNSSQSLNSNQQNVQTIDSKSHQSIYSTSKSFSSELPSNNQPIANQNITAYNLSLTSTQSVNPTTVLSDATSRSSSSKSEAIVQDDCNTPFQTLDEPTSHLHNLSSAAKNPINLINQDSTNIAKPELVAKSSLASNENSIQNQQGTMIDQSKLIDKQSYDSNNKQSNVKSFSLPPINSFTGPNNFFNSENSTSQLESNYQQSTFQKSTFDSNINMPSNLFSNDSINSQISHSSEDQNSTIHPSLSTTQSIRGYFDSTNASNQSILSQQSTNLQSFSQQQNVHTHDLKSNISAIPFLGKSNNSMAFSSVQNTLFNVLPSDQQLPLTNKEFKEAESSNLDSNTLSKEITTSKFLNTEEFSEFQTNSLNEEIFKNKSESITSNLKTPDNIVPNDQFSNLTIDNKQNISVDQTFNQKQVTSDSNFSKGILFDKKENPNVFQNFSSNMYDTNKSTSEFVKVNQLYQSVESKEMNSLSPDSAQTVVNQFPPQQLNNTQISNTVPIVSSAVDQLTSKANTNISVTCAVQSMLPTESQYRTQSINSQSTSNVVLSAPNQVPTQIFNNQRKSDPLLPFQSISSPFVTSVASVSSSSINQLPPKMFDNQTKSNVSVHPTFISNSTQQFNVLQTPNVVSPVSTEPNISTQMLSNQPKSTSASSLQSTSNLYSTQIFNSQLTPTMVAHNSSIVNQLPPPMFNNQLNSYSSGPIPTVTNQYPLKTFNNHSTPSAVPPITSNINQFPIQTLNGPIKSENLPPSQPVTSEYSVNSFNNQPIQNFVPTVSSAVNQLPPSIFENSSQSNNIPPLKPVAHQSTSQIICNPSEINVGSPLPSTASQLPSQMLSNQGKVDVLAFQAIPSGYPSQPFNNEQRLDMVQPVSPAANQLPTQINNQSKLDESPLQPTLNQHTLQPSISKPRLNMLPPVSSTANQFPSQILSNQPKLDTSLPNKLTTNQYPPQSINNQSIPNIPLQTINQYSSQPFNSQSKLNAFPSSHQSVPNKYPQPFTGQQNLNHPSPSNQFYSQTSSVQPSQWPPRPSINQPIQSSTTSILSTNFTNPIVSQQKPMNLSSNLTTLPPNANLLSGSRMLPPNPLHPNNYNQVQRTGNIHQSQPPSTLLGHNAQSASKGFPQLSNMGYSNQINYQQLNTNYGQQGICNQPQDPYRPEQNASVVQQGFAQTWGHDALDLLKTRDVLPGDGVQPPEIKLPQGYSNCDNCSPDIFRCTLNKFPSSKNLLDKSRLPLGILIHPYKDLSRLTVLQCETITRCRNCRSYINPFVQFIDNAHWKCNLCYRVNELPGEFQIDPYTKRLGDPSRRPEILNATIEYIASQDYMVRPPQPALYLFLLDVSRIATLTGYLEIVCDRILTKIMGNEIPGDSRTNIGFITYDSSVHFYQIANSDGGQPKQLIVSDISDIFLPLPDGLMVNLEENKSAIKDLLTSLPNLYKESYNTGCALGAALQAAFKILAPRGGRVTVFQACLPNVGPGSLQPRDDGTPHTGDRVQHMAPSTDFYKKLALECSAEQIAVDMFFISSQYLDIATISGIAKYSAGCIHNFPQFDIKSPTIVTRFINCFDRYLSRKIGFEALLRLRCTRGVAVHSFHGNFFVRSSDLLMLPNVNPDNAYGMQLSIEDSLDGVSVVCFQAALLYTSSNAERRIRVHTLCIPVTDNLNDVFHNADQQAITGLIAKMAVDRSTEKSLSDAREAFFNAISDSLSAFKAGCSSYSGLGSMLSPMSLKVFPLYILATLKHVAFRTNQPTRLDERMFSMCQMKSLPLNSLIQYMYPDLYPIHTLEEQPKIDYEKLTEIPLPPVIQLSAERIESNGIYLMDDSETLTIVIGHRCSDQLIQKLFGYVNVNSMPELITTITEVDSKPSYLLRSFISYLQHFKSYPLPIEIIKDNGPYKLRFYSRLIEDKFDSSLSYYEFLQRLSQQVR